MNRFLKYILVFILPFPIIAAILEYEIRQVPNPYKYKYEWMQKNAADVVTLVFGSSHTFWGIRPEYLEGKAFNLANVSQGWEQDWFLLNYWANNYKQLRTVILPISFFSWFSQGMEYGFESFRCRYYKIYMDCNLYSDFSIYSLELFDWDTARIKLQKLYSNSIELDYDELGCANVNKLTGKNLKMWENGSEADAAIKRHTAKNWDFIAKNQAIMKHIAVFCKNRNIQLILITTPCWSSYTDNLDKKQLAKMYELTHQFQHEYQLPYFDYLKDPRFTADDFIDSNHLSDVGAIKFSQILNADILSLSK